VDVAIASQEKTWPDFSRTLPATRDRVELQWRARGQPRDAKAFVVTWAVAVAWSWCMRPTAPFRTGRYNQMIGLGWRCG
jgi:hypothetical protein